jgi:hypothetical protein
MHQRSEVDKQPMQLTKDHILQYITTIRLNYENAFKVQSDDERVMLINSWFAILKEYPKEVVDLAVINALRNSEFPPRIGTITKEIERLRSISEPDATALWDTLHRKLSKIGEISSMLKSTYIPLGETKTQGQMAQEALDKFWNELDPMIRGYYPSTHALMELANMDYEQLEFEKGRFLRDVPKLKDKSRAAEQSGGLRIEPVKGGFLDYPQHGYTEQDYERLLGRGKE